jgi:hypothetical protein
MTTHKLLLEEIALLLQQPHQPVRRPGLFLGLETLFLLPPDLALGLLQTCLDIGQDGVARRQSLFAGFRSL